LVAHVSVMDQDGGDNGRVTCMLDATGPSRPTSHGLHPSTSSSGAPLIAGDAAAAATAASSTSDRNQSRDDVTTTASKFDLVWLFDDEYRIQLTTNSTATRDVEYRLTITCRDHGFPAALTSSVAIRVVVDYDETLVPDVAAASPVRPRFLFPAPGNDTVRIAARLPVGHVVAVLRATGTGSSGGDDDVITPRYELVDGNGSAYFDLDGVSGHVTVARTLPADSNATTFKLIVGVGGASGDTNVSMLSLAELYVAITRADSVTSLPVGWSLLLADRKWSSVALVVVIGASLVLGAILFAAILLLCRKSRRDWSMLRRRKMTSSMTSSYRVAVEFTAGDDGLNNVAMATCAPAASLIGRSVCIG